MSGRGGRLVLTGVRPLTRRMLEITGLDGTLRVAGADGPGGRAPRTSAG